MKKGTYQTEKTKLKIRETLKRKGIKPPINKGDKLSDSHKRNLSLKHVGNTGKKFTDDHKNKISLSRKINKFSTLQKQELLAGRKKPITCELCGRDGRICFDHCHKTGKFRGWICLKCNSALGMIDDNLQTLELMILYLKKHA
jgi:hypothetical protein